MMTPEILQKENAYKTTVLHSLVFGQQLLPQVLLLPWDKDMFVYECLQTNKFRAQIEKKHLVYIDKMLAELMKACLSELRYQSSAIDNFSNMQR